MSSEDKHYYTPEISEFYVGFRYEYFEEFDGIPIKGDGWTAYILPTGGYFEHPACPFGYYKEGDLMTDFRVKCLDRQDIEELGWQYVEEHAEEGEFSKDNYTLFWTHTGEEEANMSIYLQLSIRVTLFMGKIRNFNELQKLMKQLYIL